MSEKKKLEEKYGKDTAQAIGTITGLSRDYTQPKGEGSSKKRRASTFVLDTSKDFLAGYSLGGHKAGATIAGSVFASKVLAVRDAIAQHNKLMKQRSQENEMPKTSVVAEAIDNIINKNYDTANSLLEEQITDILKTKLHEMKKIVAAHQFNEAVVWPDGKVHTTTGEMILPSVWRQRRGLTEMNWEDYGAKQHAQAEADGNTIGRLRDAEWNKGIRDAQRPAIEYKEEREKILKGISKAVLEKHPNVLSDPEHMKNAKEEFHAAIMKDYSNHPIAQYYGHSHKFEGLHPSVQGDIERQIKSTAEHDKRMKKDPKYRELHNKAVERGEENLRKIKASREAEKAAMAAHVAKIRNAEAEASKPGPEGWSKKLDDEIPH